MYRLENALIITNLAHLCWVCDAHKWQSCAKFEYICSESIACGPCTDLHITSLEVAERAWLCCNLECNCRMEGRHKSGDPSTNHQGLH